MRLRSTIRFVAVAVLLFASEPARAGGGARCGDVLARYDAPASDVRGSDPLRAACRDGITCTSKCGSNDDRYAVFGSFDGGFLCPGKRERFVSLFPCGDAPGMHGVAGIVVLLQATPRGWRSVGRFTGSVLSGDACKVESAAGRNIVVCKSGWGPYQGVVGTSLCVTSVRGGSLVESCPVRVSSADDDPPSFGAVRVLPGPSPEQASIAVEIGQRRLLLEFDEKGVRLSARTKAELAKDPIPGVDLNDE